LIAAIANAIMRPDKVAVRSNVTFGQTAVDRNQERGFLEVPGQVPYPIERDFLPRNHIVVDLGQNSIKRPGSKRPSRPTQSWTL
jgi:hypothetical protein